MTLHDSDIGATSRLLPASHSRTASRSIEPQPDPTPIARVGRNEESVRELRREFAMDTGRSLAAPRRHSVPVMIDEVPGESLLAHREAEVTLSFVDDDLEQLADEFRQLLSAIGIWLHETSIGTMRSV